MLFNMPRQRHHLNVWTDETWRCLVESGSLLFLFGLLLQSECQVPAALVLLIQPRVQLVLEVVSQLQIFLLVGVLVVH